MCKADAGTIKGFKWKEKVRLVHDTYIVMKRDLGYYLKPDKIPVFNQPRASDMFLAVGTTKTSIAKFWIGVGALKQIGDGFIEYVAFSKTD